MRKIFLALQKVGLQVNINKCEFDITKIRYLELITLTESIFMDCK